jgi:hypothetical protein
MRVNQNGVPINEEEMFQSWSDRLSPRDMEASMRLLLDYFHLEIWRTNATKHGNPELELREIQ